MNTNISCYKPVENGNGAIIKEVNTPMQAFSLIRYESISNYYSEEPKRINVKLNENSNCELYEQIFRMRMWIPNKEIISWMIYSNDREVINTLSSSKDLIIRKVKWNRSNDMNKVKSMRQNGYYDCCNDWPNLDLKCTYINNNLVQEILSSINEIDNILLENRVIENRDKAIGQPSWNDIELMRLFNWGQIHVTWDISKENHRVENKLYKLNDFLDKITNINNNSMSIYEMDLDFTFPTDLYKSIIQGSYISD